jgi:dUTP pyrophosphatase
MTNRLRGFERVSYCPVEYNIELPKRATKHSAGYDFRSDENVIVPSIWNSLLVHGRKKIIKRAIKEQDDRLIEVFKPTLVSTGIKAYMQEDEYLQLTNRSSNPLKNFLLLANGVGVIDADYYNNEDNEGHIMFQFINFGFRHKDIKVGDKIGQGTFLKFLKADGDGVKTSRNGGFGSTDA